VPWKTTRTYLIQEVTKKRKLDDAGIRNVPSSGLAGEGRGTITFRYDTKRREEKTW